MTITWSVFTQYIKTYFAIPHQEVKKFNAEFLEQFGNLATIGENYPVLYMTPTNITIGENVQNFTFDIYCLDVILKDRSNIDSILSQTQSILTDLYNFLRFEDNVLDIDIITESNMTPINNYLLDYDAGWRMSITVELPNSTECDIPFDGINPPEPSGVHITNSDGSLDINANCGSTVILEDISITLIDDSIHTFPAGIDIDLSGYDPCNINPEPGIYVPGSLELPWNEVNPNVIVNSGSILKTLNDNDWNAGADFIIEKNGDFILNFNLIDTLSDLSVNVMAGVDYFKANSTFNYVGIDMAFYRVAQNAYIFENSINVYQYPLIINDNTLYTIERIGNIINYKIDGNTVRTQQIINISKMYFTSSIFKSGSEIGNINIEY